MGGTEGNARLTGLTAAVLLVLLAAEGATIPFLRQALTLHVFLGLLLIPPAALKLAATGWRFLRYYRRDPDYIAKGPPPALLRLLVAPLVVVSTLVLLGTGVLLVVMHPHGGIVLGLHKASFLVWFWAMSAHVVAHASAVLRHVRGELGRAMPGRAARQLLVAGMVVAGLAFAVAELPAAHAWAHWATSAH